jgi:hypothetical protein
VKIEYSSQVHPFKEYGIAATDPCFGSSARAQAAAIQTAHRNLSNINLKTSRGDWTAIGLFLAEIRGWEVGIWRRMDDAKPKEI